MFKTKLDCVNLSHKLHTTVFLLKGVNNTVAETEVEWDQINDTMTDSPLVMLKLQRIFKEDHPHVIVSVCTLNAANTLAKYKCKAKPVSNVVKSNCKIVKSFTLFHVCFNWSKEWNKDKVDSC